MRLLTKAINYLKKIYLFLELKWNDQKLQEYLKRPMIEHNEYGSEQQLWTSLLKIKSKLLN